jgi:hypothetical protein
MFSIHWFVTRVYEACSREGRGGCDLRFQISDLKGKPASDDSVFAIVRIKVGLGPPLVLIPRRPGFQFRISIFEFDFRISSFRLRRALVEGKARHFGDSARGEF